MSFQSLPEVAPSAQHIIQLVTNPNFLASSQYLLLFARTTRRLVNRHPWGLMFLFQLEIPLLRL